MLNSASALPTREIAPGVAATRMGLGLAALGRPGYINLEHAEDLNHTYDVAEMASHTRHVLDAAWAAGIRYFDVARSYGKAESFLHGWVATRGIPTDEIVVGSKWGYTYTANWRVDADKHEIKEHSIEVLERHWQESSRRLREYLDLYQIHSATLESGVLDNVPVLTRLAKIKAAGPAIGLSVSGAEQERTIRKALQIDIDGTRLFDTVQATWNLYERSAGDALKEAHTAGMGVIIKEAVANGRLTPKATLPQVLKDEAKRLKVSVDALAIGAVLAQPWADVVLSGAATIDQLRANLRAFTAVYDERAETNLRQLIEDAQSYWERRGKLKWN